MNVPEQGVKLLLVELRGGRSPMFIVRSGEVDLTCGEVWKGPVRSRALIGGCIGVREGTVPGASGSLWSGLKSLKTWQWKRGRNDQQGNSPSDSGIPSTVAELSPRHCKGSDRWQVC